MQKILILVFLTLLWDCDSNAFNKESQMSNNTNHLHKETSPYLLQHKDNPVHWYPWSEEAFERARREDKPVLLSIGYAACHWCHVMAHESFENQDIAAKMNELYINIKVDREERPDVDQVYMEFVRMYTGSGGWPLTVFLTPNKKPFFGGTYFPPEDRYGRPGFRRILDTVSNFYHNDKEKLERVLQDVEKGFSQLTTVAQLESKQKLGQELIDDALKVLSQFYEPVYGGIGNAPKFPAVQVLTAFLRHYKNTADENYLKMITHTLDNMAAGGIFDHLGGGFARYSVDQEWLVPHFEKMLYDNAQLTTNYLDTYLVTGNPYYLDTAEKVLEFMIRDLRSPEGGFYSSLDADSEGEEGKFYVWDRQEVFELLGTEQAKIFCDYYDITAKGNFEGKNILHVNKSIEDLSKQYSVAVDDLMIQLEENRKTLFIQREKRIHPGLDDKMISSWNGLALSAFSRAFQVTRKNDYREVILQHVEFIKNKLMVEGTLKRTYKNNTVKYDAYLSDYANIIQGLLDAYEAIFDNTYLILARKLIDHCNNNFWDAETAGYFFSSAKGEKLIHRLKDDQDQSIPSGTGIMLLNNLRFYSLTEDTSFIKKAELILQYYGDDLKKNPYGMASYLSGLDFYLSKPKEILILKKDGQSADHFLKKIFNRYLPNKVVTVISEDNDYPVLSATLFADKKLYENNVTIFVCQNFSCSLPVITEKELLSLLD